MGDCCEQPANTLRPSCPGCGRPGREVDRVTLKALLRPEALTQLGAGEFRFCPTSDCPIVYYGLDESFQREDVLVPVFQKETEIGRTVCYCFAVTEEKIRLEVETSRGSASAERIKRLVQAGRCACEVRNPQGTCCLGNVSAVVTAAGARSWAVLPDELVGSARDES